uniref:Integrase catalytic domain-containing protein n=1 Tax=Trichogramma kaykai TaxID=54128 RepID=A0ABD2WYW6_9HYME
MKYGLMSHLGPATRPFEIMSVDTIGGFGGQRSTKKYLHLLVDHFTRFAFISTSKTQNATDFIKLIKEVLEVESIGMLLADQYPGINSREFKEYLKENQVKLIFTDVNTPSSNGLNERLNQTLVNKMRCKINEKGQKKAWMSIARECVSKYNETEYSGTGFAPIYLLEGKESSIVPEELRQVKSREQWIEDRDLAFKRSIESHEYNKKLFDKNRKHFEFDKGDWVYIENDNRLNRKKLDNLKIGPFQIKERISNTLYSISTEGKKYNPLVCDCKLYWFVAWLQNLQESNEKEDLMSKKKTICTMKSEHREYHLQNMPVYEMGCSPSEKYKKLSSSSTTYKTSTFVLISFLIAI